MAELFRVSWRYKGMSLELRECSAMKLELWTARKMEGWSHSEGVEF